jgi:hypothetical protein
MWHVAHAPLSTQKTRLIIAAVTPVPAGNRVWLPSADTRPAVTLNGTILAARERAKRSGSAGRLAGGHQPGPFSPQVFAAARNCVEFVSTPAGI